MNNSSTGYVGNGDDAVGTPATAWKPSVPHRSCNGDDAVGTPATAMMPSVPPATAMIPSVLGITPSRR